MSSCSDPWWNYDDLNLCFRHRYIQELPAYGLTAVSFSALAIAAYPRVLAWITKNTPNKDPSCRPLLANDSQETDDFEDLDEVRRVNEIHTSYGSIAGPKSHTLQQNKTELKYITVVRSISDRLRVAAELVFCSFQLLITVIALFTPSIYEEWESTQSTALYALILLWSYSLCVLLIRIYFIRASIFPKLGLWIHSTTIYLLAWIFTIPNVRSALVHPYSRTSKWFYLIYFLFSSALFVNSICTKLGDKPVRLYTKGNLQPSSEPVSSLFSQVTFSWADPIVWQGYFHTLKLSDVWELREDDHAHAIIHAFRKIKSAHGIALRMIIYFRSSLAISFAWAFLYSFIAFGPPFLMKIILEYVEDPSRTPANVVWLCVVGMLVFGILDSIVNGQSLFLGRRICLRIRAIIIGEVYSKALRRRTAAKKKNKLGEGDGNSEDKNANAESQSNQGAIINLMAVDAYKVSEVCSYLHLIIGGILIIAFALTFLYTIIGWSAFTGAAAMCVMMPLNYYVSSLFAKYQRDLMAITDERVNKLNELLQSIRIVKYFAWEEKFSNGVKEVRDKELLTLRKRFILWSLSAGIWFFSPILITLTSFATFTLLQGRVLTAPIAFTSLALFNIMKMPMDQLAEMLNNILQAKVSIDRVEEFLNEAETSKYEQIGNTMRGPNSPVIGFENATFSWMSSNANVNDKADFKLRDLDIDFQVGELNIVVGPTGAGKTSLLLALLGEMELTEGRVFLPSAKNRLDVLPNPQTGLAETVAFCAQQPWLLNDTVKNNIIFGCDFHEGRYNAVIEACALSRDLQILDAGDATEIGEKGITLSGGQKQRVSLARAIYSNSKHLLLDDCLSAVDSHTALAIYENCLTGPLCFGRTIILVSHNVALTISQASHIIVMENGRVIGQGLPAEMAARGLLGSDELVTSSAAQSASATRAASSVNLLKHSSQPAASELKSKIAATLASSSTESTDDEADRKKSDGKLIQEEESAEGHVNSQMYVTYMKSMGGIKFWTLLIAIFIGFQSLNVLQAWWIKVWTSHMAGPVSVFTVSLISKVGYSNDVQGFIHSNNFLQSKNSTEISTSGETSQHSALFYVYIYGIIAILYAFAGVYRNYTSYMGGITASRKIFNGMLDSIMSSKIRFFDATPIGRIMNRFSKDIESIDQDLTPVATGFVHNSLLTIVVTLLIGFITPGFLIAGVFITVMYWAICVFYLASSRELKRLDSISKSPIFQHFGETLSGISTIRAYGIADQFITDNFNKVDDNHRPFFYMWLTNRWLSIRLDFTGALVSFSASAMVLLSVNKIDAGLAGLSLSYSVIFSQSVLWIIRLYAVLEMNMNSVERVEEYMNIEKEAPSVIPDSRPPIDWPSRGEIEVNDLSLRYAHELPLVIKNVTFKVESFNKIGIVGRTGAGKSTIITAFFRFLEADNGFIKIDGLDISRIGLRDLREKLAIIPQDPTLFIGTIRSNLDPFGQYSDESIFEALHRVHLIKPNHTTEGGTPENLNQFKNLDNAVTEGGHNLSQGQRQLICLARSLLKAPKVLLLDEATASIDYQSDAQIQKTIREEFSNTTILTIAHRLKSIIDYDKILVMDAGKAVEYDHPHVLLSNPYSIFYSMCAKSGELETLLRLAEQSYSVNT